MSKKQELKDALGQRMKGYEMETRTFLEEKKPTIMRLDGKAFHTYTTRFKKPFDHTLIDTMDKTAIYLCSKIQAL
jgi:tRNA(His) guanylyltransferase